MKIRASYTALGIAFLAACLAMSYLPFILGLIGRISTAVGP
jgi:hypothetical protein